MIRDGCVGKCDEFMEVGVECKRGGQGVGMGSFKCQEAASAKPIALPRKGTYSSCTRDQRPYPSLPIDMTSHCYIGAVDFTARKLVVHDLYGDGSSLVSLRDSSMGGLYERTIEQRNERIEDSESLRIS